MDYIENISSSDSVNVIKTDNYLKKHSNLYLFTFSTSSAALICLVFPLL